MKNLRNLFSGMLAVLAVLLLTGCDEKDNPVRTSLDVDTSTLTLSVGESAVRMAFSKAEDAVITYTSSKPAVAMVDQFGKVTAMSEGSATITIEMAETKKSGYAAKTITYEVVVKNVSAQALANVDKATPLTLVAQADGKITVTFNNGITLANDIKYTINAGAEQTIAKNTTGSFDIEVKKGDVVQLYSLNTSLGGSAVAGVRGTTRAVDDGAKYINIRPSMKTEIYGNVMSLLKGKDGLEGATALEAKNAFYGLFAGAEKLVNNTERLLVLPATTLTESCYQDMFNGCKGIEKAPELPAPKLEKNCYREMFYDCAKLNHVKCLATDITAENCTKDWLGKAGSEATGEKVLESVVPMTPNSDDGVPTGWTEDVTVAIDLSTLTADYEAQDGDVLTGTLNGETQKYKISIADGATVTLDDVTINGVNDENCLWAGITCLGDATIILKDGSTNTVQGFYENYPGIQAGPTGKTLTIKGTGSLEASSNDYGAGIGGGYGDACGNIIIEGGTITATGGNNAAGIGSGDNSSCGTITISGGKVTATGGADGAGIGSGADGSCGNITITTGVTQVTATKGDGATNSIGAGNDGSCGTVTIGGKVYWDGEGYQNGGDTYLTINPIIYPAPEVGGVSGLDPFAGGGDPLAPKQ